MKDLSNEALAALLIRVGAVVEQIVDKCEKLYGVPLADKGVIFKVMDQAALRLLTLPKTND